jgi:hypothetical protein
MIVADRCIPFRVVISTGGIVNSCCKVTYPRMDDKFLVGVLCISGWPVFLTVSIIVL